MVNFLIEDKEFLHTYLIYEIQKAQEVALRENKESCFIMPQEYFNL